MMLAAGWLRTRRCSLMECVSHQKPDRRYELRRNDLTGRGSLLLALLVVGSFCTAGVAAAGTWTPANTGLGCCVLALTIDPTNPSTVYAGTDGLGGFKTTNGGGSWSAANTGLTSKRVLGLEVSQASTRTVYAGTYGGGVFKTTNGGSRWSAVNTGL